MKRAGGLAAQLATTANLELALRRALRGKRDRPDARAFLAGLPGTLEEVGARLREARGPVGQFTEFIIHDPKLRLISAPCFADRVFHHAVVNVCEPALESYQIHDSYACRRGKGQFAAIDRATGFARHHGRFLKLDIRKYFESIPRHRLWYRLTRRFREESILELWWQVIDSWRPGEARGLPIGSLTSQHLANFYLAALDHEVKEGWRVRGYVRYMDDCVLWAYGRREIRDLERRVRDFVERELDIALKSPFANRTEHGMDFLGYRIFPAGPQLNVRSRKRFQRKWLALRDGWEEGEMTDAELGERVRALVAFTERAACAGFRRAVLSGRVRPRARHREPTA